MAAVDDVGTIDLCAWAVAGCVRRAAATRRCPRSVAAPCLPPPSPRPATCLLPPSRPTAAGSNDPPPAVWRDYFGDAWNAFIVSESIAFASTALLALWQLALRSQLKLNFRTL